MTEKRKQVHVSAKHHRELKRLAVERETSVQAEADRAIAAGLVADRDFRMSADLCRQIDKMKKPESIVVCFTDNNDNVWDVTIGPEYDGTYYVDMRSADRHLHHYCGPYPPNAAEVQEIVNDLLSEAAE